jgi:hypothetical protein
MTLLQPACTTVLYRCSHDLFALHITALLSLITLAVTTNHLPHRVRLHCDRSLEHDAPLPPVLLQPFIAVVLTFRVTQILGNTRVHHHTPHDASS